jgi:hypothetical protein
MKEFNAVLIKNNRVIDAIVFNEKDDNLLNTIVQERQHDLGLWVDEKPTIHSSYEDGVLTLPTNEYLFSIGVINAISEDAELVENIE